jgi:S-adenosylmethionine hydrolase
VSGPPPIVTLLTDFGDRDAYVGVMKGVILAGAPGARIVDLSHGVPPQDVLGAAFLLETAFPWFPPSTIHVAVVDPGVGTERAIVALRTPRGLFLAPDNGLLSPVVLEGDLRESVRVRVEEGASATFHGRDVFAPAAARLAAGVPLSDLGPHGEPAVVLPDYRARIGEDGTITGRILHLDRFGNAISSIRRADMPVDSEVEVEVHGRSLGSPERTYGDVGPGMHLVLLGSSDHLEIAIRDGSAADTFGLRTGDAITVRPRERDS